LSRLLHPKLGTTHYETTSEKTHEYNSRKSYIYLLYSLLLYCGIIGLVFILENKLGKIFWMSKNGCLEIISSASFGASKKYIFPDIKKFF